MITIFPALVLLLPTAAEASLARGTQLTFRGSVAEVARDRNPPSQPGKTFDLILWVMEADESGSQLHWLIDERGQGAWPWIERFGRLVLDAHGKAVGPQGPALLYDYGTGRNVIPLAPPFLSADAPLAKGSQWQQDGFELEVEGARQIDGRDTWQVAVRNNFGLKRTLWVQKESSLVVSAVERVFMDKGTEYQLELKLVGVETLPQDQFTSARQAFGALLGLRGKLKRAPRTQSDEFTPEQRGVLAEQLPALQKAITFSPLTRLVQTAARELEIQSGRADALARLAGKQVGRQVQRFGVLSLAGEDVTEADLAGSVVVLHFWEYRDEPLKEPYGQVGYLEFLHNRRKDEGVKVFGIAVDGRLQNDATRRAAAASVRKLKNFMNLTYPILLDDGELVEQFGDPRLLGAALPLFVVVDRNGKIVHYHVGTYAVDRQEGLKDLDAVVAGLAKPH